MGNQSILRGNVEKVKEEEDDVIREVIREVIKGKERGKTTEVTQGKEKGKTKEQESDIVIKGRVTSVGLWVIKQMNAGQTSMG